MKALIAMSGGVDSSVAAYLMAQQGYECVGCTMKLYGNEDVGLSNKHTCCSLDDIDDAKMVARKIGMEHYTFNFQDRFKETVVDKFIDRYEHGMTPNPCIDCNKYMKFGRLYKRATELGCEFVVTGHYARIEQEDGKYVLKKGVDSKKDQSYVLYDMTQETLAHTILPLGAMEKPEIRKIAEEAGFINSHKPDSQDICFVPDGDYAGFIERYTGKTFPEGDFYDMDGKCRGKHKGIVRYTIGQHKHLGVELDRKMFVCAIDAEKNQVILGDKEDLFSRELDVIDFNWISGEVPEEPVRCKAKIRYRQEEQWATATATGPDTVHIVFDEPQRAITPGQAAVLYDEDIVLGGGTIILKK